MSLLSDRSFGAVIAYLLPGFTSLWSVSPFLPPLAGWLEGSLAVEHTPSVGGFLYVTLASLIAGLAINVVRWVILDTFNAATGIKKPTWDDRKLQENFDAFQNVVDQHFRYYQFYTGMMIAAGMVYAVHRFALPNSYSHWIDLGAFIFFVLFGFAQRDALDRYYTRASHILDH